MPGAPFVTIKRNGTPLSDRVLDSLDAIVVDNSLKLPDSFSLSFVDNEGEILKQLNSAIGDTVQVSMNKPPDWGPVELVNGEITAIEVDYDAAASGDGTRTIIRGMDRTYRLQNGRKTRTWTQVTASEVATEIAGAMGLSKGTIDNTTTTYDHLVQGNVTDLEFLRKLGAENAREVVIADGKFHFREQTQASTAPDHGTVTDTNPDPLKLVLHGQQLRTLHATIRSAGQVKEVEVRGWDPKNKQVVKSTATARTSTAATGADPVGLATKAGGGTYVSVTTPFSQSSETASAAQDLADHLASSFAELEGTMDGHPDMRAGATVNLSNVGPPIDGKFKVTSVSHRLDHRGYETSFVVSGQHDRSLLGLVAGGVGADDARFPGVVVGIVTDVNDPERLGRVKVKFPWLDESSVSDWARMVHFGAGKNRGALFLPEVDDEVLVAFEQGDPRRPYVLGGLYNAKDTPNEGDNLTDSQGVRRRGYVSKQGSMMIFFDDPQDEGIALLSSDKNLKVSLNKTNTIVHIASNGEIKIEGATKVTVDGGQELVLTAKQKISIGSETTQSVEVNGAQVKVQATAQAALSAPMVSLG